MQKFIKLVKFVHESQWALIECDREGNTYVRYKNSPFMALIEHALNTGILYNINDNCELKYLKLDKEIIDQLKEYFDKK